VKGANVGYPVIHFEVYGGDAGELRQFYRQVFGWRLSVPPDDSYAMVDTDAGGAGIPGGIAQSPDGSSRVVFYVLVPDINAHLERVKAAGGDVVMGRTDFGVVITALARDPQGNVIGLTEEALPSPH
jgi:hypothetical protein